MANPVLRVAVVHDWLLDYAGSERVLAGILRCFPGADLFALIDHMSEFDREALGGRRASTTFLQRLPGTRRHIGYYLPLWPLAIEQLDLSGYDLVLSSSHAVAKGVVVPPDALHVSYVHSPMRYAWDLQSVYLREEVGGGLPALVLRCLLHRLRAWDRSSAAGVDHFVANSRFVARRILKAYRREAHVIFPPVDTDFFRPGGERGDAYLAAGRLVAYKRLDLLLEAFRQLPQRRLVVAGDGPQYRRLKAAAPPNVAFTGYLGAEALREQMQQCRALLFPGLEDFGMTPVEAMACGAPVIGLAHGGCAETVDERSGVLFDAQTPAAIGAAIRQFEAAESRFTAQACRHRAEQFSHERFDAEFSSFVAEKWRQWRP